MRFVVHAEQNYQSNPIHRSRLTVTAFILHALMACALTGCKDNETNGTSGPLPECEDCDPTGDEHYACIINGEEVILCFEDVSEARNSCGAMLGNGLVGNGPIACDSQYAETNPNWTPGSYVSYNSGTDTHEIDASFFSHVLASPEQLLYDSARVEWQGTYFEFDDVATSDFAYILGFRNGDKLVSVNGKTVASIGDAWGAFDTVYGATSFTVLVSRSGSTVTLYYSIQ